MGIKVNNNAVTTLAAGIAAGDTALTLTSGASFPSYSVIYPTSGYDYSYAVLEDDLHNIEIVKIVNRVGALVTVQRAQEGTTARAFSAGAAFEIRATVQTIIDLANGLTAADIGVLVQAFDADTAKLDVEQTWTAQQTPMNGTLTDGATIDWNGDSNGQVVKVTLAGNRTLNAPTNITENNMYLLRVTQDGTGSRTLAWNAAYKFPGGIVPTLTTTASAVDIFTFVGGGSNVLYCIGKTLDAK